MRRAVRLCLLSGLLASAACSNLSQLSSKNPQDIDFQSRLGAEYLAYSQSESEQGQKQDAEYYAGKGLRASKGESVEPEPVPERLAINQPKSSKALTAARKKLLATLTPDAVAVAPQQAARAQLLFDCWVDQQQELEADEIVSCSEEYKIAARDLAKATSGLKKSPRSSTSKASQ